MAKVITAYLPDGNPNGIKIIKVGNHTNKAFIVPRGQLVKLREQEESDLPALYFLFGETKDGSRGTVYIGETEKLHQRIATHDADPEKEDWTMAIAFAGSLDRTDVKYLESKSVSEAKHIDRVLVLNKTSPTPNTMSQEKKAVADESFDTIQLVLGFLGHTLFQEISDVQTNAAEVYFAEDQRNKDAKGVGTLLDSGEFVVYSGSLSRREERPGLPSQSRNLRKMLQDTGVININNDRSFIFTKDYIFRSPSAAGDVVMARSVNGWLQWKDKDGKTLDENRRK